MPWQPTRTMTLTCEEFLHRFLQHVLPKGLPRIRYYGWLATRRRGQLLPLCRALLHQEPSLTAPEEPYVACCLDAMGRPRSSSDSPVDRFSK